MVFWEQRSLHFEDADIVFGQILSTHLLLGQFMQRQLLVSIEKKLVVH